jgi:benzoylformate decarboxylase
MSEKQTTLTVYQATYDLLRKLGLTTIFGNPGSTEQPFLKNFPTDFEYVLGLQEATAVAMADGFAQATGRPALLNLHTSAGTGHGMGNIMTAFHNKTPLIITAGQQTREMILCDPYLTNRDETTLPRPWVKWAYQPVRAQDVPGAIMRAYAAALQPPAGPVYLSIPLSDWDEPALGEAVVRTVSTRYAPDPARLVLFSERIQKSKNPVLIYGPEIERSAGWESGIKLAERLQAPVYLSPLSDRASFPQTHPLFRGMAPIAVGPLSKKLSGHDLIVVVGAQIFRYYPYIAGEYLPQGADLLQITSDPYDAAAAKRVERVGFNDRPILEQVGIVRRCFVDKDCVLGPHFAQRVKRFQGSQRAIRLFRCCLCSPCLKRRHRSGGNFRKGVDQCVQREPRVGQ